jgi:signal transduction histidine kinase
LFLACKEALNNVARHADASEVRISMAFVAEVFEMTIEDNGRGFHPGAFKDPSDHDPDRLAGGNGLSTMNQRLAVIGGHCEIASAPGRGTQVTFRVFLNSR